MLALVTRVVRGPLVDDGVLVRVRVDVVVELEAVGGRDFGRVVVLVEGGEALGLALYGGRSLCKYTMCASDGVT